MPTIDDAWSAVQDNLKKLADAIGSFRTIEVATTVSDFEVIDNRTDTSPMPDIKIGGGAGGNSAKGLVTRIDMLTGDVLHNRSPNLDEHEAAHLKDIHDKHVELGQHVFKGNITFIADTVKRYFESSP